MGVLHLYSHQELCSEISGLVHDRPLARETLAREISARCPDRRYLFSVYKRLQVVPYRLTERVVLDNFSASRDRHVDLSEFEEPLSR